MGRRDPGLIVTAMVEQVVALHEAVEDAKHQSGDIRCERRRLATRNGQRENQTPVQNAPMNSTHSSFLRKKNSM